MWPATVRPTCCVHGRREHSNANDSRLASCAVCVEADVHLASTLMFHASMTNTFCKYFVLQEMDTSAYLGVWKLQ